VSGEKPRQIAAQVLQQHRDSGDFIEKLLERALHQANLTAADRRLCQELTYGVVRWQATLDWLIDLKTDDRPRKPLLQTLLRLGLYQIFWLDRIPDHAAVDETVELARHSGLGRQTGFVNALLRGFLRESDATRQRLAGLRAEQPHLGYSHPQWLVRRWQSRWGPDKTSTLLEWNNTPPGIHARLNTLRVDLDRLLERWQQETVAYNVVGRDWYAENLVFELKSHPPLLSLPSFQQGAFYIQDPSTLIAVTELNPRPGESILDLCAAPGGKATFIAELMRNEGLVVAHDNTLDRLKLLEENCKRLGVTCIRTALPSTLGPQPSTFDRILVDAPCSNTGVLRRRVDLRWRIRPEEIQRLAAAQFALLEQAVPLLKPGGTLVYSTCSLEPEENQEVTRRFLNDHNDFQLQHERELLPFVDLVDGAYVARLRLS
jgi:16S rRNA (cytosine967-C5)-methyltransferase